MAIPPGTRFGDYEVVGALGAGGMGEVYRARDVSLGREVALKVLPIGFSQDPGWRRRFEREARLLASLSHPNLATVHRFEAESAPPYLAFLVMELVPGDTLATRLEAGPMAVAESLDFLRQVAGGLEAAHDAGIIHRDLKPSNIKITPEGGVKILDFGLAKSLRDDNSDPESLLTATAPQTAEGSILGTAPYMSPEQARGKAVDRRTDIWAFGCVAYEMLCGHRAFVGDTATDTIAAVLRSEPIWSDLPAQVPPRLLDLLKRCLQKDPARRLRDARDLRLGIEDILAAPASADVMASAPAAALVAPRSRLAWLPWSVAGVAAIAAGVFWWTSHVPQASPPSIEQFTQLTDQIGQENWPNISPDGKSIAYASQARGSWDIYVQRVGGHNSQLIAGDPGVDERAPAFSPDGALVAFHHAQTGGIFVVGATGESARRLTDFGFHPAWSADGRRLAFCTEEVTGPGARFTTSALWVVDVAGGVPRKVFDGDAAMPAWSPSSARLVFWAVDKRGQRDLFSIAADGGPTTPLTDDAALDWAPVWSPDGAFIFFASDRGGPMNIWRLPVDEATGRPRGAPEPVTNGVVASAEQPSISKDGTRMVFRSQVTSTNPFALPFDPATERVGEPKAIFERTGILGPNDVSPDGRWLALRNQGEAQEDLFISRTDGSDLKRLTDDMFRDRAPVWAPDGSQLAFYANRSSNGLQIWTIKPDGSGLTQVSDVSPNDLNFPLYSPSGDRIVATAVREHHVFAFDLSKPLPITNAEELLGFQVGDGWLLPNRWSPDGRYMVGQIVSGSSAGALAIYDVRTRTSRKLSDQERNGAAWLPDSRRVIAIGPKNTLTVIDVASGARRMVTSPQLSGLTMAGLVASPDGRALYFGVRRTEADIWMATLR